MFFKENHEHIHSLLILKLAQQNAEKVILKAHALYGDCVYAAQHHAFKHADLGKRAEGRESYHKLKTKCRFITTTF